MTQVGDVAKTGDIISQGKSKGMESMSGADFLKLLITQLTNQDPMEPMKNQELLQQLSAIRSLESNMSIAENFKDLLGHQELGSATVLIGKTVKGLSSDGKLIEGVVERVIMDSSGVRLQVGDYEMALPNVMTIELDDGTVVPATPPATSGSGS